MGIWSILEAAERGADRIAVVDGDRAVTYRDLGSRVRSLARGLVRAGVAPGDRVAIVEVNSLPFLECYFAAAGAGAILSPLNARLSAPETAAILRDSGARVLVAGARFSDLVGRALEEGTGVERVVWIGAPGTDPGVPSLEYEDLASGQGEGFVPARAGGADVAHLYYTSGTTGRPKGVMLTHSNVCAHARAAIEELGLSGSDVWGHFAPMFHLADAWAVFAVTLAGGRHVMAPRFEAGAALRAIKEHRITLTNLIPSMLDLVVRNARVRDHDLSSLRIMLSGGAPISPDLVRRTIETLGCDYVQTYGMTETSPYLTLSILDREMASLPRERQIEYRAMTGRPFKGVEIKVVDEAGDPVVPDGRHVGEILARGETVTPGYWNMPGETAAAFRDGWLCTGDLAVVEPRGFVNIVDRRKDMIITGGENVYSIEVENALHALPGILEAAVFGVPDATWGEAVTAAVVLEPGASIREEDVREALRGSLAGYKIPRSVRFLEELPRTGSGKIAKRALRERFGR